MSKQSNNSKTIKTNNPPSTRTPSEGGNLGQIPVTKNPPPPKPKK